MSRAEARIKVSIWQDPDFLACSSAAQRAYHLALEQHNVTFAGVVPYTPRSWAMYAPDTTPRSIAKAVAELVERRFVLVDETTAELWIRSLVKHDVAANPKLRAALRRDVQAIRSPLIAAGFRAEYPRLGADPPPDGGGDGGPDGGDDGGAHRDRARAHEAVDLLPIPPPSSSDRGGGEVGETIDLNAPDVAGDGAPAEEDRASLNDEDLADAAIVRVAELDLEDHLAIDGNVVRNRSGWLTENRRRRAGELLDRARLLARRHAGITADELARHLRGDALPIRFRQRRPEPYAPAPPDQYEAGLAAARAAAAGGRR
jgi:hypothetical protein